MAVGTGIAGAGFAVAHLSSTVTLPLWLVVLLLVFAALAILERILLPGVRWALRRRANRAIEKLNSRLSLQIQPFKTTRRKELINRLMFDGEVIKAIEQHVAETGEPRDIAGDRARRYASEIVPSFSAFAYFRIGTRIARLISKSLYRVRLGHMNDDALRGIDPNATVVFVMNHRSNMDYLLVTYLAATSSALSYAVGEWAQIWGLRAVIRSMGAYFIRRNSRNALYRRVLARYVAMATEAGVTQAVFPEGGLSRDGKLRKAKLGLLSYMLSGFGKEAGGCDIIFIPVGVNYDRVLEDRTLIAASKSQDVSAPKFQFSVAHVARFLAHQLWLRLRGRWHRFGYACVSFGEPVSLRAWQKSRQVNFAMLTPDQRATEIDALGHDLMTAIGRVIPSLPVSLAAGVLLDTHDAGLPGLTTFELKGRIFARIQHLESAGAHVHIPRADLDYAIDVGLRMLDMRHLISRDDETIRINPDEHDLLRYYANAIVHLLEQEEKSPIPVTTAVT
ncbi:MAG: 1-acyl-sn-glycerol-3-phosphate acyltransferase [Hyphomicrobiaceae bacterium]